MARNQSLSVRPQIQSAPAIWMEGLEQRSLFSAGPLTVAFGGTLPTQFVDNRNGGDIQVNVTNNGSKAASGPLFITILASPDDNLADAVEIKGANRLLTTLKVGKTDKFTKINLDRIPASLLGDSLTLFAEVSGRGNSFDASVSAGTSTPIPVVAPAPVFTTSALSKFKVGKGPLGPLAEVALTAKITNSGNATAFGPVEVDFGYSTNANGSSPIITQSAEVALGGLAPGQSKTVTITDVLGESLNTAGDYYAVAIIDATGIFGSPVTAVSSNTADYVA